MDSRVLQIAIDGPAGAGKSTLSRLLAERLGLCFLESGATYRAFAVFVRESGQPADDEQVLEELLSRFRLEIDDHGRVLVNGREVTAQLREPEIGGLASKTSAFPAVREALVAWQRRAAEGREMVMEGRDIGTVVLPGAPVKFFVTASAEVRARRRVQQQRELGVTEDYSTVLNEIQQRDHRDSTRAVSPLRPAADAHLIDTSELSVEEALRQMIALVEQAGFRTER